MKKKLIESYRIYPNKKKTNIIAHDQERKKREKATRNVHLDARNQQHSDLDRSPDIIICAEKTNDHFFMGYL